MTNEIKELKARGFVFDPRRVDATYHKKIGSYTLKAALYHKDGKPTGLYFFIIGNSRRHYDFRYRDGELYVRKRVYYDWERVDTLYGVPASVMKKVETICNR